MPWYKSGTVSVTQNSNAVLGAGTAFLSNARVGDAFRGPDGGWYEVINIASDTALAISPNYQGATNAAGVYALAPMQGYVKDSADALRSLVNQYGAKLAALGTTGNYEILPVTKGGTGLTALSAVIQGLLNDADAAEARATLLAAKSGANSDITGLSGMTTALSVTQGGTGSGTAAGARTNLGLKTAALANTLGPVASGDIMESGVNGWGTYEKYACGTLILRETRTVNLNVAAGSYVVPSLVFAAPTVGPYNVATELTFYTGNDVTGSSLYGSKQTYGPAGLFINTGRDSSATTPSFTTLGATSANSYVFRCLIVGRWV